MSGSADLFGLADTFPRPGWVVLDAARDHRFTGELAFDLSPPVHMYLDRGEVYLAERSTEPSLGARLLDAGALNAEQLALGSMRIGPTEHLGRLFERVPSIDRDFVVLVTEMMNDECIAWAASHDIESATSTPYVHHPSGIHRWHRAAGAIDLVPGDPLPAPAPTAAPVDAPPPPVSAPADHDALMSWNAPDAITPLPAHDPVAHDPVPHDVVATDVAAADLAPPDAAALDAVAAAAAAPDGVAIDGVAADLAPPDAAAAAAPAEPRPAPGLGESLLGSDWADRLETHGLPEIGSDPLAAPAALPPVPTSPPDRFELTWPSGEIDDEFDAGAALGHLHERDHDRAGPTARVVRATDAVSEHGEPEGDDTLELWDFETTAPSFGPPDDPPAPRAADGRLAEDPHLASITDDAVLSMRRAVESIEEESLACRHAPQHHEPIATSNDTSTTTTSVRTDDLVLPGRVATRTESSVWSIRGFDNASNRSVFDEVTTVPQQPPVAAAPAQAPVALAVAEPVPAAEPTSETPEPARVSALRRLIGSLGFR